MSDGTRSSAMARRRNPLAPTTSVRPLDLVERARTHPVGERRGRRKIAAARAARARAPPLRRGRASWSGLERAAAGLGADRNRLVASPHRQRETPIDPGAADGIPNHVPLAHRRERAAARERSARRTASKKIRRPRSTVRSAKSAKTRRTARAMAGPSARAESRDLGLDPVELRDLGIPPLELVEEPLRLGRVAPIEGLHEDPVQERSASAPGRRRAPS